MEIFIKASQFILSLSLLIVLHELGHFIPAKLFKTKVEKFYLFFDYKFSLFKKKIGETVYGIGWIPLGGYVKIAGMIDESMDTEQLKEEPKPWEFRSKPAWQRLIIMLGGVIVNFVLGWFIYVAVTLYWGDSHVQPDGVKNGFAVAEFLKEYGFQTGDKILKVNGETPTNVLDVNKLLFLRDVRTVEVQHVDSSVETLTIPKNIGKVLWEKGDMKPLVPRRFNNPVIDTVLPNKLAHKAGIVKGDIIRGVNGNKISYWEEFQKLTAASKETVTLEIERNNEFKEVVIKFTDEEERLLGVAVSNQNQDLNSVTVIDKKYSLGEAISVGSSKAYWTLADYITQFKYVFTKKGAQSIGGFISIGSIFLPYWDWQAFWSITAFLSIMLGFMNLLPIPALDGGHVVFTLWEMITGKKPSDKFLEYAQVTGFILLIALLLFANGNDVVKLIKQWF